MENDMKNMNLDSSPSTLQDIPDFILVDILSFLGWDNVQRFKLVSKRWQNLIENDVLAEVWVSDVGFRTHSKHFFETEFLPRITIGTIHSRFSTEPCPRLKSPEKLKNAFFYAPTTLQTYRELTLNAINLEKLNFGYNSLTSEVLSEIGNICFPNLKHLKISDRNLLLRDETRENVAYQNIIGFLCTTFPSLITFSISVISLKQQAIQFTLLTLGFIQRHFATLRELSVTLPIKFETHDDEGTKNLEAFRKEMFLELADEDVEALNWQKISQVKLMEIDVDYGVDYFVGLDQWIKLLESQKSLEHLSFGTAFPIQLPIILSSITSTKESLISIQVGVDVNPGNSGESNFIDCSYFENFSSLKMLCFVGEANKLARKRFPRPEIFNLSLLPQNIQALALEDIYVETKEICKVVNTLSNLNRLALQNVGTNANLGITLALLEVLVERRKLKEIIIKGINGSGKVMHQYETLAKLGMTCDNHNSTFHIKWCDKNRGYQRVNYYH